MKIMKDVKKKETGAESQKNLKDHDKGRSQEILDSVLN